MLEFAVTIEGVNDNKPVWVLALDPIGERLLTAENGKLLWHPMADCTFTGLVDPGKPKPVVVLPQQQRQIVEAKVILPGQPHNGGH